MASDPSGLHKGDGQRDLSEAVAAQKERLRALEQEAAPQRQSDVMLDDYTKAKSEAIRILTVVTTELVAGMGLGGFCGWYLDRQLGTFPLFFLVLLFLGFAAAMYALMKYMRHHFPLDEPAAPARSRGEGHDDGGETALKAGSNRDGTGGGSAASAASPRDVEKDGH